MSKIYFKLRFIYVNAFINLISGVIKFNKWKFIGIFMKCLF